MTGSMPRRLMIALHHLGSGGVARVTVRIANGLAERGVPVTLVLLRPGGVLADAVSPLVHVRRLAGTERTERGLSLLPAAGALARAIRAERPDVLLSPGNHMHVLTCLAHRRAKVGGCQLVLKLTNSIERRRAAPVRNAVRRAFYRWAARSADQLLVLSHAAREELTRVCRGASAPVAMVRNPYIDPASAPRRAEPLAQAASDDTPILLSVGRLTPQKDQAMMLTALAGLTDRPWSLCLLGEGPRREPLERQARKLGIADRVQFRGFVPDPAAAFRSARMLLLSSRWEELPAVLFEALDLGCPIVSTDASPAIVDLLDHGRLGRIVPVGDVGRFRAAIGELLDAPKQAPAAGTWLQQFTVEAGVGSHAEALALDQPPVQAAEPIAVGANWLPAPAALGRLRPAVAEPG